jgi:hypothetical protein
MSGSTPDPSIIVLGAEVRPAFGEVGQDERVPHHIGPSDQLPAVPALAVRQVIDDERSPPPDTPN